MAQNSETALQAIINNHIQTRQKIYTDLHNTSSPNNNDDSSSNNAGIGQIATALGTVFSPPRSTDGNNMAPPEPTELRSLIDTSLTELSPLARKAKYIDIQLQFAKYYNQTTTNNENVINIYQRALDETNKELINLQKENKKLHDELISTRRGESTHHRQIKTSKYNILENQYYRRMYTTILVVLLATISLISILGQPILHVIGRQICIMILATMLVLLSIYSIYYVYFHHPSRDIASFHKYRWSTDMKSENCLTSNNKPTPRNNSIDARATQLARSAM